MIRPRRYVAVTAAAALLTLTACSGDGTAEDSTLGSERPETSDPVTQEQVDGWIGQPFDAVFEEIPIDIGASVVVLTPQLFPDEVDDSEFVEPESDEAAAELDGESASEQSIVVAGCIGSADGQEPYEVIMGALPERLASDEVIAAGQSGENNSYLDGCVDGAEATAPVADAD